MSKEEKSGVQKLRELHQDIKKSIKPSQDLIDSLIQSGKIRKEKEESDKKVARPRRPEAGA